MVANLVSNAADVLSGIGVDGNRMEEVSGSGHISLQISPMMEQDIDGIAIDVHDSGPGIAQDKRESIFRPFITSKEAGEGTGLGLAITQRIVERHAGRIRVGDSEELGGALFSVWIPVTQNGEEMVDSEPAVRT